MRVLVVDDEDPICVAIELMLARRHIETVCVATGEEALRIVRTSHFGLALVDWGLPDMTGRDALTALRLAAPGLKMIVITGADPHEIQETLGADQPDSILLKPFTMDALLTAVDGVCGNQA